MTCVTWSEAYAFCIWDGGFLPSDAEWGYAAAGGSQQREYPWGSTDPGTGNQYAIFCAIGAECAASGDDAGASWAPVGTAALGAGRWGQLDLAGEAAEWVLDLSGEPWTSALVNPCTDCASLDWIDNGPYPGDANRYPGPFRVTRTDGSGGVPLLSTYRSYDDPEWMEYSPTPPKRRGGFRCARTP
jgi:formylglycine-generating enzyme required for sulfatase activity